MKQIKRGGSRPGAGAKKKNASEKKEPTKVIRVPVSKLPEIEQVLMGHATVKMKNFSTSKDN